jgi:hypothetical protein
MINKFKRIFQIQSRYTGNRVPELWGHCRFETVFARPCASALDDLFVVAESLGGRVMAQLVSCKCCLKRVVFCDFDPMQAASVLVSSFLTMSR